MGETTGPRKGEAVYSEYRRERGYQPNGKIFYIDWEAREIHVEFFGGKINTRTEGVHEREVFTFDDFEDMWDDKYRGRWLLS